MPQSAEAGGVIFQELDNECFIIEKKPDDSGFSIPRRYVCPIVRPLEPSSGGSEKRPRIQGE
jgi:hypothetical protein